MQFKQYADYQLYRLFVAAQRAHELRLTVHAGHNISYANVAYTYMKQ